MFLELGGGGGRGGGRSLELKYTNWCSGVHDANHVSKLEYLS